MDSPGQRVCMQWAPKRGFHVPGVESKVFVPSAGSIAAWSQSIASGQEDACDWLMFQRVPCRGSLKYGAMPMP